MPTKALILKPDMTFIEKTVRTKQNLMKLGKKDLVSFNMGRSVFRERLRLSQRWKIWKKRRNLILVLEGSNNAFELAYDPPKPEGDPNDQTDPLVWIQPSAFTKEEADNYISKLHAQESALRGTGKLFTYIILILGVANLLLQLRYL